MEGGVVAEVVLPLAIFLIMVSMGMTLTTADFRRVLATPKPVGIGLLCQLVLLPLLGFAVATAFDLEPVFAVGVVLLASAPGGTTSNLIVHAADADRALSVTLTALSNSVVWLTMPFLLRLAIDVFEPAGAGPIEVPVGEVMLQVAALTIVPVLLGMAVRRSRPAVADRAEGPSKVFAGVFLLMVIIVLVIQNLDAVIESGPRFAPAFITLNLLALGTGFGVAKLARLDDLQALTISIETGLQNSTLAIGIAITLLGDGELALIPGLYGVWMLVTGFTFALWFSRRRAGHVVGANA